MNDVAHLVRLFAENIAEEHTVEECRDDCVVIRSGGSRYELHLDAARLRRLLAEDQVLGRDVWGETLPPGEAAARIMSIHLDESLDTRDPDPDGCWVYDGSGFNPISRQEAYRRT